MRVSGRLVVVATVVLAAPFIVWMASARDRAGSIAGVPVRFDGADPGGTGFTGELSRAFRYAAQRALPGVVHVQVRTTVPSRSTSNPRVPRQGEGSGFVFREDGYILTNNHVVQTAERVVVVLPDRREFEARVVGRDNNTDVAVLEIDAKDLAVVEIGDSDRLDVGDWVVALGYPLQLGSTATAGIVSAKSRSIRILPQTEDTPAPLENFIQTDAVINPGNSGGPLVDLEGRVVGMNTAIAASPTGLYSGYGFAIPINLAVRVAGDLIRFGELHRPRLGVGVEDVDPADAEVYGLDCVCGSEIVQVAAGTAADSAGLELGDVIRAVDGRDIESTGELLERLARSEPGRSVRLRILRRGEELEVAVQLGEFEPTVRAADLSPPPPERGVARLGFAAQQMEVPAAPGPGYESAVVISAVDPTHPAARAPRLSQGLIIESVNGQQIRTLDDLRVVADRVRPGQAVSLIVRTAAGDRTIINYRLRS